MCEAAPRTCLPSTTMRRAAVPFVIVLALLACSGSVAAQTPAGTASAAATFHVYQRDARIGTASVSIARTDEGWRVQSTSTLAGALDLAIKQLDLHYDASWRGRFMTIETLHAGRNIIVHVAVLAGTTRTDIVTENEARFRSHSVSADTIFLPDHAFGAYEALAAPLERMRAGMDVPLLLAPDGETRALVDAVTAERVMTATGAIAATRFTLQLIGGVLKTLEVWVDRGRLLRVDVPRERLSAVRSDVLP